MHTIVQRGIFGRFFTGTNKNIAYKLRLHGCLQYSVKSFWQFKIPNLPINQVRPKIFMTGASILKKSEKKFQERKIFRISMKKFAFKFMSKMRLSI